MGGGFAFALKLPADVLCTHIGMLHVCSAPWSTPLDSTWWPFSLDILHLTCLQCLKLLLFCRFLQSMRDFTDESRVCDESDAGMQGGLTVDYGKLTCEMFGDIAWELSFFCFPTGLWPSHMQILSHLTCPAFLVIFSPLLSILLLIYYLFCPVISHIKMWNL